MNQFKTTIFSILVIAMLLCGQILWAGDDATPGEKANIAAVKKFIDEAWNKSNSKILDEIIDANCVFFINGELKDQIGPSFMKWAIEQNVKNFPGYTMTIKDIIAKADKVVLLYKFEGVFKQLKKPVTADTVMIFHFDKGKVVKSWAYTNQLSYFVQLGFKLTPPPGVRTAQEEKPAASTESKK